MPSYLVSIDFRIAFAKCDPTPDQKPPGIPEEIAELNPQLVLHCIKEDAEANRTYSCALVYEADTDERLIEALIGMFDHLPGFEIIAHSVDVKPEPTDKPVEDASGQYTARCHFKSGVPMKVLLNSFKEHIANGHMVANGPIELEYVAWVTVNAVSGDDVPQMVQGELREAFAADTQESALNFQPITTTLM